MTTEVEVKVRLPDAIYESFKKMADDYNTSIEHIMLRSFVILHVLGQNLEEDDHLCIAKFTDEGAVVKAELTRIFPLLDNPRQQC